MKSHRVGSVGGLLLAGCVGQPPPPPGKPMITTDPSDPSDSTGTGTMPTTGPAPSTGLDSTGGSGSESEGGGSSSGSSSGGGDPLLVISDGPTFDFGDITLGATEAHLFIVSNEGDAEATDLDGQPLEVPFEYAGGGFPGAGGTCTDTLAPRASCVVDIAFTPASPGLFDEVLTLTHDGNGEATRPLGGGGAGQSANLLINPGGEDFGSPPPGWADVGDGTWEAGLQLPPPAAGQGYLYAATGPNLGVYRLEQSVDASSWDATIDQDALNAAFEGQARALDANNDQFLIEVSYEDAGGTALESYSTGWKGTPFWATYDDMRTVPAGTRTIRVGLQCTKLAGNYCSAYFDALSLVVSYP